MIDFVGLISVISGIGYVLFSESLGLPSKLLDIWAGLSTELLGAWAVARIVEFAMRKNIDYDKIRIRVARNLRYYPNLACRIIEFNHHPDMLLIQREVKWSINFCKQHEKCFHQDELEDLELAYCALNHLIELLLERNVHTDEATECAVNKKLYEQLATYELLAFTAECNIFEETPEVP